METLKALEKEEKEEKEFFYYTGKKSESDNLRETIQDLQCIIQSLRTENELLINENITLIDKIKNNT